MIKVTKYVRITGGSNRAHSPVLVQGLSRPQMGELCKYLEKINHYGFISENEDDMVIYKVITERSGFLNLNKKEVKVEPELEEVLPHIETCHPGEKIEVGEVQGYINWDDD